MTTVLLLLLSRSLACHRLSPSAVPGSTKAAHAAENIAGATVELSAEEIVALEQLAAGVAGERGAAWYMEKTHEAQVK